MQNNQLYFSLIAVFLFGLTSWVSIGWRVQKYPELRAGYYKLFFIWAIWLNAWTLVRIFNNIFENEVWFQQLFPMVGNYPRLGEKLTHCTIYLLGTLWIFLGDGDKTLEKYPGWFMLPVGRAERIRVYWVITIAFLLIPILLPESLNPFPNAQHHSLSRSPEPLSLYFPIFFPVMWVLVGFLLSLMDGWQWLSENYRFKDKFEGKIHGGISGMLCGVGFRGILRAGAVKNGLYLGFLFLLRVGHPPLFIPWEDITCGKRKVLFFKYVVLEFKKNPGVLLMIPEKIALKLSEESGSPNAFNPDFPDGISFRV